MSTAEPPAGSATRIGLAVGALFGLVFVLLNAGGLLDQSWTWVLQGVAAAVFAATLWFGVIRARGGIGEPPGPNAMRVYNVAVTGQLVAILVGAVLLNFFDRPLLVLPWVVMVVGAHFVPFAATFRAPQLRPLAWILVGTGLVGGLAVLLDVDRASPATGVVAGFVLLGVAGTSALGAARTRLT